MYSYPLYSWLRGDGAKPKGFGGKTYINFKANWGTSAKNTHPALNLTVRRTEEGALIDAKLSDNIECHIGGDKQKTILMSIEGIPHILSSKHGFIPIDRLL